MMVIKIIENLFSLNPVELMGLLLIILIAIPFIFLTIIAIWVFKDAKKHNMNAVVWVLIVWIIPFFFGLIVYLVIRDKPM